MKTALDSRPVLIAGGGIGGLAAALALVREGYNVKVIEQSAHIGEIGAGIQLSPNAFAAWMRWASARTCAPGPSTPTRW
ncbi:NAD(P)-binding protein [Variovorax sp. LjRoot84]|uniref:NAD(P)-binding protein n=1 Tax=Variovorax sp. LjRoot84 TaxID=3342340 RepID=UPI003F511757